MVIGGAVGMQVAGNQVPPPANVAPGYLGAYPYPYGYPYGPTVVVGPVFGWGWYGGWHRW